jgi:hypothetical protein
MPELARLSFEIDGDVELARVAGEVDASNVDHLMRSCWRGCRTTSARWSST